MVFYRGRSLFLNTTTLDAYKITPIMRRIEKLSKTLSPVKIALVSYKVLREKHLRKSKLSLVVAIKCKIKNATGKPAPSNREFFERLNKLEAKNDIQLIANISKNKPITI